MGFELCYLPDMPAVLRTLAGAEDSIERWWQQLEAAKKHREGSGKVINALAMAASYDPDPTQFLGIPNRYEEFSDNHTGVDYRMDESLAVHRTGAVRLTQRVACAGSRIKSVPIPVT